jgi:short subunit dehydrogenase-like uncharacterized protein
MVLNILLYGATGYSGRLIASEMKSVSDGEPGVYRMTLAGRDAVHVRGLAQDLGLDYRIFGLDDADDARRAMAGVDVVINAAGPFAWTAERLAKVALATRSHYVDIGGEADVYRKLDDLARYAGPQQVALVCGAGFWAAASDVLLDRALSSLPASARLGAIRIAMSRIKTFSRGSAATVWRSLREQVIVVRRSPPDKGRRLVLWHEPVGKLERTFDFSPSASNKRDRRIASAASLVDTLTARLTVARHKFYPRTIESYVEMGPKRRAAYQLGALLAPFAALPPVSAFVQQSLKVVPEGPTKEERERENHIVLLEIDDACSSPLIDWRWETPSVYQFTAQLAVAVATQLAKSQPRQFGWLTPAQALAGLHELPLTSQAGPFRGSNFEAREI